MFGIGLPEMILIMALALIVVGPDKLPDLARSLAKGIMELKKTAEGLKESFAEEGNPLDEIKPDLEEAAKTLKSNLLETPPYQRDDFVGDTTVNPPDSHAAAAYEELMKKTDEHVEREPIATEQEPKEEVAVVRVVGAEQQTTDRGDSKAGTTGKES